MTFLPIVERELRAAARHKSTYWTRFWFAAIALIVWFVILGANRRIPKNALGHDLFLASGIIGLLFCLVAGIFLTADCLSEEKREGTLGLLFLTDLKGYDVVLGKLAATSMKAAYGLVAMFPLFGLSWLLGGVTAGEFLRVVLALIEALLLSLAVGMFVSSICQESRQAIAGAFLGMLILAAVLPAVWWGALAATGAPPFAPGKLLLICPVQQFRLAFYANYLLFTGASEYWQAAGCIGGLSLTLLAFASWWLPRSWLQHDTRPRRVKTADATQPVHDWARIRRAAQMQMNPFAWLAGRRVGGEKYRPAIFAVVMLFWGFFLFYGISGTTYWKESFIISMFAAFGLHLAYKLLLAIEVSRQLNADRRSGALELLMVTPLTGGEIIQGQRQATLRRFLLPLFLILGVNLALASAVICFPKKLSMDARDQCAFLVLFGGGALTCLVDSLAITEMGIWMSLRASRHHWAALSAFAATVIVPWAAGLLMFWIMVNSNNVSRNEPGFVFSAWVAGAIVYGFVVFGRARVELNRGLHYLLRPRRAVGSLPVSPSPA